MKVKLAVFVLLMLLFSTVGTKDAAATLMETQIWGKVGYVTGPGNELGLAVGNEVYGLISWDDQLISGVGYDELIFDASAPSSLTMSFDWGTGVYSHSDDRDYSLNYPSASFQDGVMDGINYVGLISVSGREIMLEIGMFDAAWELTDKDLTGGSKTITVEGDFYMVTTTAKGAIVPEPATVALLGMGLVGLAGAEVRRRRKKKAVDKS